MGRTTSLRVSRRSLRIGAEAWGVGSHHSRKIFPSYPKSSASPRVHLCSLVSARKSSHQARLALSQGRSDSRKFHLGSGHCLLLRQKKWTTTHQDAAQSITSLSPPSATLPLCLLSLSWQTPARPQHLGSGTSSSSPPMSAPAKPSEADAQEWSRRARRLLVQAALWAPSMAERDPGETAPTRWPGAGGPEHQLSPTQPVVRRSETGQTAPPPQW